MDNVISPLGFVDPSLANADAAAEAIAAQQRANADTPRPEADREADVDGLLKDIQSERGDVAVELGTENGGAPMPLEGAPKEVAKPAADPAPAADPKSEPAADPAPEAPKGTLDSILSSATTQPTDQQKPAADPYGDIKLRSDASPKTRETFEHMKTLAKQREDAALAEANAAKQSLTELQNKVAELEKRTVPDDVKAELEELRQFRAQFAAEQTPEFKQKYDGRIDGNYASIFAKLTDHGLPEAELAKLKAFSPSERDQAIETFLDKLPTPSKRFIELKLADNLGAAEERQRALLEARSHSAQILEEQRKAPVVQQERRIAEVAGILKPAIERIDWLQVKDIPATAAPEVKKQLEASNAIALELQEDLKRGIVDDSPKTRADAAIAIPYAKFLARANADLTSRLATAEKELSAIREAGKVSRAARSSASPNAPQAKPRPASDDPGESVDAIFNELQGQNRR